MLDETDYVEEFLDKEYVADFLDDDDPDPEFYELLDEFEAYYDGM